MNFSDIFKFSNFFKITPPLPPKIPGITAAYATTPRLFMLWTCYCSITESLPELIKQVKASSTRSFYDQKVKFNFL